MTMKNHVSYEKFEIAYSILLAFLFWWTSITLLRNINSSYLRYFFPLLLIASVLIVHVIPSVRVSVLALVGVTLLGTVILWSYERQLVVVGIGLAVFNGGIFGLNWVFRRAPKAFILHSILIGFGLALALGIGEIVTRVVPTAPLPQEHSQRVFGTHILSPGNKPEWQEFTVMANPANAVLYYWIESTECTHEVVFNAKGLRGPELSYEKPENTIRIMFLGDSFIEAIQVPYEQTVYVRLAELIAERGLFEAQQVTVFGVGTSGWGTLHEYLYYQHEGYRYSPDLVIVVFISNDPTDNMTVEPKHSRSRYNHRIIVNGDDVYVECYENPKIWLVLLTRLLEGLPSFVKNHSALWRLTYSAVAEPFFVLGVLPEEGSTSNLPPDEAWERTGAALRLLQASVAEHGGQLVIMSVPRVPAVEGPYELQDNIERNLRTFADAYKIPWLNLLLSYRAYVEAGHNVQPDIYGPIDVHWSANGHRVTAEILLDWLVENDILESLGTLASTNGGE